MKNLETNLNDSNILLYAAKHYYNPTFSDIEEFNEDLKRFKYIKRLINRYLDQDNLGDRLLMNHIIVVFNVFGIEPALNILHVKLDERHWPVMKPFLVFLSYIKNDQLTGIKMDDNVVEVLRKI
jgi:hypothetical protein|tara:strand:- start:332 stop:703 length:372 start_codon:yes stop_codon:yes gene_type:complete